MRKNFEQMFAEKMAKLQESVINSNLMEELEIRAISSKKLDEIRAKMSEVVENKPVWEDYSFRTGKIIGILRFMLINAVYRDKLCYITGLNSDIINAYYAYGGNLPYAKDGVVIPARPMNPDKFKELIKVVAAKLGVLVEESDLSDISEERWERLVAAAQERAEVTAEEQRNEKKEDAITYEE